MRSLSRSRLRSREVKAEINIVPLLDVLLVLLLVFMATAPIISQSVEVELPQASQSKVLTSDDENKPVILEVSGVGQYAIVINSQRTAELSQEDIISQVQGLLETKPKTIFLIGGAKDVPYEEVIKALNLLQKSGVSSVGLMTKPLD